MKRMLLLAAVLLVLPLPALAAGDDDVARHPSCQYCGMHRDMFAHSRMLIEYEDGSASPQCSLHCAGVELANSIDKVPARISVGDYKTKKLIDAESAHWVLGGKGPGVMTARPKWAFENRGDAEEMVRENGGEIVSFEQAIEAAYQDMYKDTRMIREKRKMKRMQADPK